MERDYCQACLDAGQRSGYHAKASSKRILCPANPDGGSHYWRERSNEAGEVVRGLGGTAFVCVHCQATRVDPYSMV
jgi:hypothetical protein